MKGMTAVVALAAWTALSGCAAMERATLREEARQLAWTGPGAGPCVFGGVTPRAEDHCALVTQGAEGMLYAVNDKVRARLGAGAVCVDHVDHAQAELARHRTLRTARIFSCPLASRAKGECHVSLLVTTAGGERFVLDNGAVVTDAIGAGGVARFEDFERQVEGVYWVGFPPSARDLAAVEAGFKPGGAVAAALP